MLAVHSSHVYVTRPESDDVVMLTDANQDGSAESSLTAIAGLDNVHGIAFHEDSVYLATVTAVYEAAVNPDGTFAAPNVIVEDLPEGGQHPYRTLGIGPDNRLYISVGSSCDACEETNDDYATILRTELDGSARAVFASGLRNTLGFGWHPSTAQLWGVDQGSDWRGDDLPPEELNQIVQDGDYGWPYCFSRGVVDPVIDDPANGTKASYCADTRGPALELQAHGSPLQMAFYTGTMFPTEYRSDAFLALHGSWNRFPPTGYKVVRVRFDAEGTPMAFDDFLTGFLLEDGSAQFGRPTGVAIAPDGALLIGDDDNGVVYRVSFDS
jgi:glucose/arabinose dehydrogenase